VGYYHVLAFEHDEAIAIAERIPEFEPGGPGRIEIRPTK
jgi:hypothetical protein